MSGTVERYLPGSKFLFCEGKSSDGILILRNIGEQKQSKITYRDRRSHLHADKYTFIPNENEVRISHMIF